MSYATEQCVLNAQWNAAYQAELVELERKRPFYLLKPNISIDGNKWCALYGENIQDGVSGFGDTPDLAARDFDINWLNAAPTAPIDNGQLSVDETRQIFREWQHAEESPHGLYIRFKRTEREAKNG